MNLIDSADLMIFLDDWVYLNILKVVHNEENNAPHPLYFLVFSLKLQLQNQIESGQKNNKSRILENMTGDKYVICDTKVKNQSLYIFN